jgi:precorrin-6B methylase 2
VNLRQTGSVFAFVFGVTLAVFVGKQMSAEAMAVVVGVVCGVAAGIPASLLLLAAVTRRDRQRAQDLEQNLRQNGYPPVVVIQGGAPQALPQGPQAGYWPGGQPLAPVPRQFHVVGGDDVLLGDGRF